MRQRVWWRMEWFRDAPIKRKLLWSGLLTSGFALLSVSLALTARGIIEWHNRTVVELTIYAGVIDTNAAPAMLFDDRKVAAGTLLGYISPMQFVQNWFVAQLKGAA